MSHDETLSVWVNTSEGWVAHGRPRAPVTAARVAKRLRCMDGWETAFGAEPPPRRHAPSNAPSPAVAAHSPAPLDTWPRRASPRRADAAYDSTPAPAPAPPDRAMLRARTRGERATSGSPCPGAGGLSPSGQPFESALRAYYDAHGISAERFDCRHAGACRAVCSRFVGACEAFVGSRYGVGVVPRLVFLSADPARDLSGGRLAERAMPAVRAREEAQLRPASGSNSFPKQGHWYKTFQFAHRFFEAVTSAAGTPAIPFSEVNRFFAHTNSAKCKDLDRGTSQGDARLFRNCGDFIPGEIAVLRPHLLVTQGRAARESVERSARVITTHHPGSGMPYRCRIVELRGARLLWIAMYHPNARDGSYQAEIRDAWRWYVQLAVEYARQRGAPPFAAAELS